MRYQDKTAGIIRATLALRRIPQTEIAKKVGIDKYLLSGFLCRRIDFLPEDIQRLLDELKISDALLKRPPGE